jgi:hypothetical protein
VCTASIAAIVVQAVLLALRAHQQQPAVLALLLAH